jgi:hypothetical protein
LHSGFPIARQSYVLIDALRAFGHENGSMAEIEEGNAERLEALVSGLASKNGM